MIDFEKIKMVYQLGRNLTLADVKVIFSAAKTKSYPVGEYLIRERSIKKEVFLIKKGLVRAFMINDKGNEITTLIRSENQIVASSDTIFFNQPSKLYYEALEPTTVFSIDYDLLQSIIAKNPKLEANTKYVLQNILKESIQRIDSFVLLSPEERYIQFVELNPDIINRVPNKYIANVLGITPVSLSRIRKRISSKKK
jgi:CRP-like cAMP-binding protein